MPGNFIDTNVLIYILSEDSAKAVRTEALLREGGIISVQVLNEFANVGRRKLGFTWDQIAECLAALKALLKIVPLDVAVHEEGLRVSRRYSMSIYDGMIVGAALTADCDMLWSEDMQHGLLIDGRLQVRNPFA
jgi:predicted nucleic acid-binding protein